MLSAEALRHAFAGGRGEGGGGGRVVALDDVTFTLDAGQTLAVFGPNGAGRAAWSCWQPTTWTRASSWPPMWRSSGAAGSCTSRRAAGAGRPRSPTSTGGLSERAVGDWLSQAWTVARKDLLLEFRTRTALVSSLVVNASQVSV